MKWFEKYADSVSDAISFYRLEDSYLDDLIGLTQKIRDLLVSKGNSLLSLDDKKIIDVEIMQISDEFISILKNANYNSMYYFNDILSENILDGFFYGKAFNDLSEVDKVIEYLISERSKTGAMLSRFEIMQRNSTPNSFLSSVSGEVMKDHLIFLLRIFNVKKYKH
jgi:flagellin-like hook-associated protein FlgL